MATQVAQSMRQQCSKMNQQKKSSITKSVVQPSFTALQSHIGNAAVQRLLAQRTGDGPTELDGTTADRINLARGGGQTLDTTIQQKMGEAMGSDFSGVRVHTGSESHQLNEQLGAKAFTTGTDVFFREGAYNPQSGSGQELIAHELTHVVQQGSGAVPSNGKMAVNAPGDQFEQEADSVAKSVTNSAGAPAVQRQEGPMPEEEEVQAKHIQRQEMSEDEEVQAKHIQRQEMPEDEEVQAKHVQRQDAPEEEEVQAKFVQRAEAAPEEEETAQMQEMPEEEPSEEAA